MYGEALRDAVFLSGLELACCIFIDHADVIKEPSKIFMRRSSSGRKELDNHQRLFCMELWIDAYCEISEPELTFDDGLTGL